MPATLARFTGDAVHGVTLHTARGDTLTLPRDAFELVHDARGGCATVYLTGKVGRKPARIAYCRASPVLADRLAWILARDPSDPPWYRATFVGRNAWARPFDAAGLISPCGRYAVHRPDFGLDPPHGRLTLVQLASGYAVARSRVLGRLQAVAAAFARDLPSLGTFESRPVLGPIARRACEVSLAAARAIAG